MTKDLLPFFRLLVSFFILVFSFALQAQPESGKGSRPNGDGPPKIGVLSGQVIDSLSSQPVEYASVSLFSLRDSSVIAGGITNEQGYFRISEIPVGAYRVAINFIGFEPRYFANVRLSPRASLEVKLGKIMLQPNQEMLKEVEVATDRDFMVTAIDRKVFYADQITTAEGGSGLQILESIPSVEVDLDGNISLRGNQNVTVLIDGRMSSLSGSGQQLALEQIPASAIERIEVITNPSAKFDPDGMSGILNVILKKNRKKGVNGLVNASIGTSPTYAANGSLNFRASKIATSLGYGYRYSNRSADRENYRRTFDGDSSITLIQSGGGDRINSAHSVRAGLDYFINEDHSLGLNAKYGYSDQDSENEIDNLTIDQDDAVLEDYLRSTEETEVEKEADFLAYYQWKGKMPGQNLRIDGSYSFSSEEEEALSTELSEREFYREVGDNSLANLQVDYVHPIGDSRKIEAGAKGIFRSIDTDFELFEVDSLTEELIVDEQVSNRFEYLEQIYAAYGIFAGKNGAFSYQAGLRLEHTTGNSELIETNESFKQRYFSWFPSAHLKYETGERTWLELSYSRRINRPRSRMLNPTLNITDPLNLRTGNPFLLPEYIHSVELGYVKKWKKASVSPAIYFKEITDVMRRIKEVAPDGTATTTFVNLDNGRNYGFELIVTANPVKWWNMTYSGNWYRTQIDGSNLESELSNAGFGMMSRLQSNWKIKKVFDIQLSARLMGPMTITQGKIKPIFTIDLGTKLRVMKGKGILTANLSDIFDTRKFRFEANGVNFEQSSVRNRQSRIFTVGFTFKFGKQEFNNSRRRGGNGFEGDFDGGGMEID